MSKVLAPRSAWPVDFPDVIIHSDLAIRNRHPAYGRAKAGDVAAAIALVRDLLNSDAVALLRRTIGQRDAILAAVSAIEKTGFNAIPDAMGNEIGKRLGLPVDTGELLQINKVAHTRASGWHKAGYAATFWRRGKAGQRLCAGGRPCGIRRDTCQHARLYRGGRRQGDRDDYPDRIPRRA